MKTNSNSDPLSNNTHEIHALRRSNHRLRVTLAALIGTAVGAAAIGMAPGFEPHREDPVSITTDGTYLYALHRNGSVYRVDIETREDLNKQRPNLYYSNPINHWNLFYPNY